MVAAVLWPHRWRSWVLLLSFCWQQLWMGMPGAGTTPGRALVNIRGKSIIKPSFPACRSMIATARPMANRERAAGWDWAPIPRIRRVRGMYPTDGMIAGLAASTFPVFKPLSISLNLPNISQHEAAGVCCTANFASMKSLTSPLLFCAKGSAPAAVGRRRSVLLGRRRTKLCPPEV